MWEDFHWPFLDNPPFPWYPYTRCKAHKNQGLTGFPAVTAVKCAECSRPSTRKTKLENQLVRIVLYGVNPSKITCFGGIIFYLIPWCVKELWVQCGYEK